MPDARERPAIFSGWSVREILAGRKTMTRRPVKFARAPKCASDCKGIVPEEAFANRGMWGPNEGYLSVPCRDGAAQRFYCPYGGPGDRLWVRETWGESTRDRILYRASPEQVDQVEHDEGGWVSRPGWRSPIHMRRVDSRLLLEVTAVRVERLQDITTVDAKAEGLSCQGDFFAKWDEIHGRDAWETDPWVWVIAFRRLAPREKPDGWRRRLVTTRRRGDLATVRRELEMPILAGGRGRS